MYFIIGFNPIEIINLDVYKKKIPTTFRVIGIGGIGSVLTLPVFLSFSPTPALFQGFSLYLGILF